MSNKFSPVVASNTTAGDRLLLGGAAAIHLSTGDLVMLVNDPSQADPNKLSLVLVSSHTTPTTIATLLYGGSSATFKTSTATQAFALVRDEDDNLAVIGCYQNYGWIAYQAFEKGFGLNWTPAPANVCTGALSGSPNPFSFAAKWCNTGGGTGAAGHVIVAVQTVGTTTGCFILDFGLMLAGVGQHGSVTTNPSFLGASTTTTCVGANLALAQDGFGANTGMAVSSNGLIGAQLSTWGVSATGLLTSGGTVGAYGIPTAALTTTTKLRIRWVSPATFAVGSPSQANARQITVTYYPLSLVGLASQVDSGTAGSFPAPSDSQSWDMAAAAPTMETVWIYAWSSATATTMLRLPITFPAGVATVGAVVTDDTTVGTGTNTTIRVVGQPVDFAHTDWQSYDTVTPFSLLGDYSNLPTQPNVATLVSPINGSAAPLAGGGVLDWAFGSQLPGDAQVQYYLRIQAAGGGALQWWTGSALTGTETAVTSATTSATIGTGILTPGVTYSWAVDVVGASGLRAGYSLPWSFTVLAPPAAPTLTAVYDPVLNRTALTIQGSVSTAPLGSIEFSDAPMPNLLSAEDASFEGGTIGTWAATTNVALANSTAEALDGTRSLRMTSVAAGYAYATGAMYPVSPSTSYVGVASLWTATSARIGYVQINWYDATETLISYIQLNASLVASTWTEISGAVTSPSNAAYATLVLIVGSAAAGGEVTYVDEIGLLLGSSSAWTPGYPIGGWGPWSFVIGCTALTVYPGPLTVYDLENSSQTVRQYRARNWSAPPTNYSGYATASVGAVDLTSYWIKAPSVPTSIPVLLTAGSWQRTINENVTVHQPLGNEFDIPVGDDVRGPTGQVTLVCQNQDDQDDLFALLSSQQALLVQSPVAAPFWIRRLTNTESEKPVAGAPFITYFENALTWTTVARPTA